MGPKKSTPCSRRDTGLSLTGSRRQVGKPCRVECFEQQIVCRENICTLKSNLFFWVQCCGIFAAQKRFSLALFLCDCKFCVHFLYGVSLSCLLCVCNTIGNFSTSRLSGATFIFPHERRIQLSSNIGISHHWFSTLRLSWNRT